MQSDLAPIVQAGNRYTAFDAAAILLREGLEALLVVGALLAFLNKSGNGDKARWIWLGGAAALVASIGVALLVNVLFAQAAADRPSRFVRVMILPRALIGKSSIQYVSEDDKTKPRVQQYKIFADAPIARPKE